MVAPEIIVIRGAGGCGFWQAKQEGRGDYTTVLLRQTHHKFGQKSHEKEQWDFKRSPCPVSKNTDPGHDAMLKVAKSTKTTKKSEF